MQPDAECSMMRSAAPVTNTTPPWKSGRAASFFCPVYNFGSKTLDMESNRCYCPTHGLVIRTSRSTRRIETWNTERAV